MEEQVQAALAQRHPVEARQARAAAVPSRARGQIARLAMTNGARAAAATGAQTAQAPEARDEESQGTRHSQAPGELPVEVPTARDLAEPSPCAARAQLPRKEHAQLWSGKHALHLRPHCPTASAAEGQGAYDAVESPERAAAETLARDQLAQGVRASAEQGGRAEEEQEISTERRQEPSDASRILHSTEKRTAPAERLPMHSNNSKAKHNATLGAEPRTQSTRRCNEARRPQ
jgi:hypothetical protein